MIRRITTFALGLFVLSALYSNTNAQTSSYVADTGVINLAPGQSLRITAAGVGSERAAVQFKKTEYVDSGIIAGVVRQQVASQTTTGPIDLSGDQCLVFFLGGTGSSVRVQIYGNSPYLKPNAFMIISAGTNTGAAPVVEEISLTYRKVELENY